MKRIKELSKLLIMLDNIDLDLLNQLAEELKNNPENIMEYITHEGKTHWSLPELSEHDDVLYKSIGDTDIVPTDIESYCNVDIDKITKVVETLNTIIRLVFKK